MANVLILQNLLDRLPLFVSGTVGYREVLTVALLLGAAHLACLIMNGGANLFYEYAMKVTSGHMAERMHEKAPRVDLVRFESTALYNEIEKAALGRERGFEAMEKVVFSIIFHGGYFLSLGAYLSTIRPQLVLALSASFLPVALSHAIRASAWYKTMNRTSPHRRALKHYEDCLADRRYCKETRTLGAGPFFQDLHAGTLAAYNREQWRTEVRAGAVDLGLKLLTFAGYLGLLLLLLSNLLRGSISAGTFGAIYFSLNLIFKQFEEVFNRLGSAVQDAAVADLYFDFLELAERTGPRSDVPHDQGVRLEEVSFRYPGARVDAVHAVSLTLRPGEVVAIVGENGAGKSTLVKLLCGLLLPHQGSVRIGGVDTREASPRDLFHGTSAVFQGFQRYRLTLRENVSISDVEDAVPDARVQAALDRARVDLRAVPGGLDTMLARDYGGVDLSGGEWQRVAIARGLYRIHDLIVLDEPTSAIDPLEETKVYRMSVEAARGKTAVLVTHRLGCARIADRIVVLDRGEILEAGTHETLLRSGGRYARLFQAQAQGYEGR